MSIPREQVYKIWAPAEIVWSPWVSPAFFANLQWDSLEPPKLPPMPAFTALPDRTAVVLDLMGERAVQWGMQLAEERGFRPVPVINASPAPHDSPEAWDICVIDMHLMVRSVCAATPRLRDLGLTSNAPPVFLLDEARGHGTRVPSVGAFDNRWLVFPEDFPSAKFLREHGIDSVVLVQETDGPPKEDLLYVLMAWQDGGIGIYGQGGKLLEWKRPTLARKLWHHAFAGLGYRAGGAGGFGGYVPAGRSSG